MPKVFLWIGTVITVLALFMGTPESNASQTSGCCPVENTGGCGEGCTAGGCASGGCSAQGNGNCCSSVSRITASLHAVRHRHRPLKRDVAVTNG